MKNPFLKKMNPVTNLLQGPDAVHVRQVGAHELKRAPGLVKKAQELEEKELALMQKYGLKAHL
jgi:acyl-CoA dehydrogenase